MCQCSRARCPRTVALAHARDRSYALRAVCGAPATRPATRFGTRAKTLLPAPLPMAWSVAFEAVLLLLPCRRSTAAFPSFTRLLSLPVPRQGADTFADDEATHVMLVRHALRTTGAAPARACMRARVCARAFVRACACAAVRTRAQRRAAGGPRCGPGVPRPPFLRLCVLCGHELDGGPRRAGDVVDTPPPAHQGHPPPHWHCDACMHVW